MFSYYSISVYTWLTVVLLHTTVIDGSRPLSDVKLIYTYNINNYETRVRPRTEQLDTVMVSTRFIPKNIIEFDTGEQLFSILGSIEISWLDEELVWSPSSFSGTQEIHVPLDSIWKPRLMLQQAFDGKGVIGDASKDVATVFYNGTVSWSPESIFSYVCEVNIQYYPFDEQKCKLTYYVSDETISTVNLTHDEPVLMDDFIENSEWNLANVAKTTYERNDTNFIQITFTVQRRANFATFTMIVPLLMLAFLNICVFLVPIDSGEKGGFSITIFLSYGIFVSIVSDTLPHNSLQISFFVLFLIVLLLFSVLSVFYTIVQAKLCAAIGEDECTVTFCAKFHKNSEPIKKEPTYCDDQGAIEMESRPMTAVSRPPSGKAEIRALPDLYQADVAWPEKFDDDDKGDDKDVYTWRMFLEQLDMLLFVAFFVLMVVSTTVFFCLMMQRLSDDSFKG